MATAASTQSSLALGKPAGLALLLILGIAVAVIASVDELTFLSWVNFLFMAATPSQIILALYLRCLPGPSWRLLRQPVRGLKLLLLNLAMTGVIAPAWMLMVTGGFERPGPQLVIATILSIVSSLWIVPVWQNWPLGTLSERPLVRAALALLASYGLALALYWTLFDFAFLKGLPPYRPELDPHGRFAAWPILSFLVTSVAVILGWALLDFWPLKTMSQPSRGLLLSAAILAITALLFSLGTGFVGWDPVTFMIRGPVCFIFGTFLVNNLMRHSLLAQHAQPRRGAWLLVGALAGSVFAFVLYQALGRILSTSQPHAADHGFDLWMATAILGVTFPIFIAVTEYFEFWPMLRTSDHSDA